MTTATEQPTGPDGRPINERVAEALDKSRAVQVRELRVAEEKLRDVIFTVAETLLAEPVDDADAGALRNLVLVRDTVEHLAWQLDTLPDYEEYVRESIEQEAQS